MIETILMIVTYIFTMAAGGLTNYIGTEKKIMCLIVIGIGGLVFCILAPHALNWLGWSCYMAGFIIVFAMGKEAAKKRLQEEVLSNFDNEYHHIQKDANGNVKVSTFTVYSGGRR